ncbi:MAG: hypothetical protein QOD81_4463 [Solirubrobacteraceae bacterium]|jgi:hypothetical protein|nr:hypothetical protein [Solirubrobacteraceae bacterium]
MTRHHAGLLDRVTAMLRPGADPPPAEHEEPEPPDPAVAAAVEDRLERLEALVEGLQDAVYRNARHQDERIEELQRRTEPDELARTLSADARRRGL